MAIVAVILLVPLWTSFEVVYTDWSKKIAKKQQIKFFLVYLAITEPWFTFNLFNLIVGDWKMGISTIITHFS